jgi:bifunctional non-homologous end joining protein LigD
MCDSVTLSQMYLPMPLVRIPEPFDHADWLFEVKHDGFRALAYVEGHRCRLVSRRGHEFRKWDLLCEEIAHSVRCTSAVLDGELVCLEPDGRSNFYRLMFRLDWPYFYAFDVLSVDGEDLRDRRSSSASGDCARSCRGWRPGCSTSIMCGLEARRCIRLRARVTSRAWSGSGRRAATNETAWSTSWVKVKNPEYSQMQGRREMFEARRDRRQARRRDWHAPELCVTLTSLGV